MAETAHPGIPEWCSLLEPLTRPDPGHVLRLRRMLLTTYDAVDRVFLAENFLPRYVGFARPPEADRTLFSLELHQRLRRYGEPDGLWIVSSGSREPEQEWHAENAADPDRERAYPWLGRTLRFRTTPGVVQHAKLWMFEYAQEPASGGAYAASVRREAEKASEPKRFLELCVSSANLTESAFKDQVQAAWRVSLPLGTPSEEHSSAWGCLPDFLRELWKAGRMDIPDHHVDPSGDAQALEGFLDLLRRADCPADVGFVASVPGDYYHDEATRWGVGALGGRLAELLKGKPPTSVDVLAPTIGVWSRSGLSAWLEALNCPPENMAVGLYDADPKAPYPPVLPESWKGKVGIPKPTLELLKEIGAPVPCYITSSPVNDRRSKAGRINGACHPDHRPEWDPRWPHAKIYGFLRGRQRFALVTSANFTASAWGEPLETGNGWRIRNFELGVLVKAPIPAGAKPNQAFFPVLTLFEDDPDFAGTPLLADTSARAVPEASWLEGAEAEWRDNRLRLYCLPCQWLREIIVHGLDATTGEPSRSGDELQEAAVLIQGDAWEEVRFTGPETTDAEGNPADWPSVYPLPIAVDMPWPDDAAVHPVAITLGSDGDGPIPRPRPVTVVVTDRRVGRDDDAFLPLEGVGEAEQRKVATLLGRIAAGLLPDVEPEGDDRGPCRPDDDADLDGDGREYTVDALVDARRYFAAVDAWTQRGGWYGADAYWRRIHAREGEELARQLSSLSRPGRDGTENGSHRAARLALEELRFRLQTPTEEDASWAKEL